jgi:hypothetical protein
MSVLDEVKEEQSNVNSVLEDETKGNTGIETATVFVEDSF